MASVKLDFAPPEDDNIVALRIYEAVSATGPWAQIQRTTAVGTYPDYISEFTTTLANDPSDWFSIAWEDVGGVVSDLSIPVKGGTTTWVGEIVKRVLERDSSQDEKVVVQEAEAAIASTGRDPYDTVDKSAYQILVGLTYLVLARSIIATSVISQAASQNVQSATIGLVSFKSDTSTSTANKIASDVSGLLDLANRYLGIATSYVMELELLTTKYGYSSYDHSRLIGYVGLE